jgi:hypothetical protein
MFLLFYPIFGRMPRSFLSSTRQSTSKLGGRAILPAAAFQAACSTASDSRRAGKLTHHQALPPLPQFDYFDINVCCKDLRIQEKP